MALPLNKLAAPKTAQDILFRFFIQRLFQCSDTTDSVLTTRARVTNAHVLLQEIEFCFSGTNEGRDIRLERVLQEAFETSFPHSMVNDLFVVECWPGLLKTLKKLELQPRHPKTEYTRFGIDEDVKTDSQASRKSSKPQDQRQQQTVDSNDQTMSDKLEKILGDYELKTFLARYVQMLSTAMNQARIPHKLF